MIKLTPLDKFFFGGEKTFGMSGNENYLIRSEYFPQQTTLLGMLRRVLLEQCGLLSPHTNWQIEDRGSAEKIIGGQSFQIDGSSTPQDFKVIQRLSPVFLVHEGERYFPCPIDHSFTLVAELGASFLVNAGGKKATIPILNGYDPKNPPDRKWISESGKTEIEDDIFKISPRPGVWKGSRGEEEEEGYYKQYFVKFNGSWCFAFYGELNESIIPAELNKAYGDSLKSTQVVLGKERSTFTMEVAQTKGESDDLFFPANLKLMNMAVNWQKIIFMSDSYVDNNIYDNCFFGFTDTSNFRFIETNVSRTKLYSNLTSHKSKVEQAIKSGKYNLLKKGSVLYVENDNLPGIKAQLDNKRFRQIGYNWYVIMNSELKPPTAYSEL